MIPSIQNRHKHPWTVTLSRTSMLTLHLFCSKTLTQSWCCLLTATCKVLQPPLFKALIMAPLDSKRSITSGWFLCFGKKKKALRNQCSLQDCISNERRGATTVVVWAYWLTKPKVQGLNLGHVGLTGEFFLFFQIFLVPMNPMGGPAS